MDGSQATAPQIALPVQTTHAMIAGTLPDYTTVTSGWTVIVPGTPFRGAMDPRDLGSSSGSTPRSFDMGSFTLNPPVLDNCCGVSPHAVASYAPALHASSSMMFLDAMAPNVALSSCQMSPMHQQHQALLYFTAQPSISTVPTVPQHMPPVMLQPRCSVPLGMLQQQQQQAAGTAIFFAGVSPMAPPEDLLKVFAQFGRVMNINLYRPYRGSKSSKGCGLVQFAQHSEAAAALQTLDGKYVWRGANRPMSVEWYCSASSTHASNTCGHVPTQQLGITGLGHTAPAPPAAGQCFQLQPIGKQMQQLPAVMPLMQWGL